MKRISTASKESSKIEKRSVSNTRRNRDINECLNDGNNQSKPMTPISDSKASEYEKRLWQFVDKRVGDPPKVKPSKFTIT